MELSLSSWMMIAFLVGLGLSAWKMYQFMPTKQLKDDDTTPQAQTELMDLLMKTIKNSHADLTEKELYAMVIEDEEFDKEHFWRFNENKLRQLLHKYYAKHPDTQSIKDIHKKLNA